MSELPEASFKRTRSDADFSQRDRKRAKTEKTEAEKSKTGTEPKKSEEQELMQYLKEWVFIYQLFLILPENFSLFLAFGIQYSSS